jgi:hypothetical protein
MRQWIALLALGALVAMPRPILAGDPEDEPTEDELLDEHMDALRAYEEAETDDEAAKAQKRFEDASDEALKLEREKLENAIER